MSKRIRFGYSFWGFLGDHKMKGGAHVSTPDGNATYSWSILWETLVNRGWNVYTLQKDRDEEGFRKFGVRKNFSAFSPDKRGVTYLGLHNTPNSFPDLDVVLLEWRFPIPGRNTDPSEPGYEEDLDRQTKILEHYKSKGTKIILWDLDHKLTEEDEKKWDPDAIFETSVKPRKLFKERTRVEPPIVISDLRQFSLIPPSQSEKLSYIGSRYERDDVIEQYIKPVSAKFPGHVHFWGNWTKEPNLTQCKQMWPDIIYHDRVTVNDFRTIYSTAVAVPLLAKRSYFETGFITPRPWEALMFGTVSVGFKEHLEIGKYTSLVVNDATELGNLVEDLSKMSWDDRKNLVEKNIQMLDFMDVKHFVDSIEKVL